MHWDLLAKQAATDRTSIELMKLVDAQLTEQLGKARKVVAWLADQVWPDSDAIGKAPGLQARRSAAGLRPAPRSHAWVWSGTSWRCRLRGGGGRGGPAIGPCAGAVHLAKVHRKHMVRECKQGWDVGPPFLMRCGCTQTGGHGLKASCRVGQAALRRLSFLEKGLHTYSRQPVFLGGRRAVRN